MAKTERRGLARGRKKQTRAKRKRHLIVSNGRVTETEYFNFLINEMDVRGSVRYRQEPVKDAVMLWSYVQFDDGTQFAYSETREDGAVRVAV